ncbi:replication gene A [Yersinia rohdei]|uniref:Replication gene A n=2 Tax=Yersinia rohdei TaxID=29485 RepID=A0A0U1HN11_YERRO|nr:replication gene A [Yersinia rohdei]
MFDFQLSKHPRFDMSCRAFARNNNLTAVADQIGMKPQMLRNKLNPDQPHQLSCIELLTLTDITEDPTLLDGLLSQLQCLPAVADFMSESFTDYIERNFTGQSSDPTELWQRTQRAYRYLVGLCKQVGTEPPYWREFTSSRKTINPRKIESGLLRMMAADWWRVRLKRLRDVRREHMAIAVGQVQKSASAYVSRSTMAEWVEQKRRNREFFKAFELENQDGERVSMEDMVNGSNANPAIRRCELMVRMRGFEDLANEMGCVGEFYTITAPSKYHAVYHGGGSVANWNGASPRQTQKYLCSVWAKSRAALARAGINIFGFRVVELHHDGTPHWHVLLLMLPQDVEQVRDILCYYARLEDSETLQSPEALKARFHAEPIDSAKGSATGYIAKYISKNIDGYALGEDEDGETGGMRGIWPKRLPHGPAVGVSQRVTVAGDWERKTDQVIREESMSRVITADDETRTLVARETTIQATDKTTVLGTATLLAGAIQQISEGDYSLATQASYVAKVGKTLTTDVGQDLIEKIGNIRSSIASARQDVIAPVVWIGSQQINVMALMLDTLDVVKELAALTAAHTHTNTGGPLNAGSITATGAKSDGLRDKYSPVIG